MSELDTAVATNWNHDVGVTQFVVPRADTLLAVFASARPGSPLVVDLADDTPATITTDRDRAVLRAFLTLALQRLDTQENTSDAHP